MPPNFGQEPTPPFGKLVQQLNTPVQIDGFYTELVRRDSPYYQKNYPIKRGTAFASMQGMGAEQNRIVTQYAANPLYLLKELKPGALGSSEFGSSDMFVVWVWASVPLAQDTYNSGVDYDGNATNAPVFTRVTLVRRKDYEAAPTLALNTALTGLLSVAITGAGTGYTQATATIATGGSAVAVCLNGAIIDWIVTSEGSNVTSGAAMTIVGDGTGATATARIQPASAILTAQQKRELDDGDPRSHDYVQVVRVYTTLPGATITDSVYDPESDIWISTSKQKKLLSDITESISHSADNFVTIISSQAIDSNMGYEVVTVIPKSPHFDETTAILEYEMLPYQFPGFIIIYGDYGGITYTAVDFFGSSVGYQQASSWTVLHYIRTWFVIGATVPDFVYDDISPTDIVLNNQQYSNVLIDDTTRVYGSYTVTIPATTPSFTEYYGAVGTLSSAAPPPDPFAPGTPPKWIGTERVIKGGVKRAGSEYRWKVSSVSVIFR